MAQLIIDGELVLYGIVGMSFWGDDGFTAMDVVRALTQFPKGQQFNVRINSPGGYSDEGVAIYNALKARGDDPICFVDGLAASAASIIALAGARTVMRPGALMMIHESSAFTIGNAEDHAKSINALQATDSALAALYAMESGMGEEDCRALMKAETWLTAADAIAKGFADDEEPDGDEPGEGGENDNDGDELIVAFNYRLFAHAPERLVAASDKRGWSKRNPVKLEGPAPQSPTALFQARRARAQARKTPAIDSLPKSGVRNGGDAQGNRDMEAKLAGQISALCNSSGLSALASILLETDGITLEAAQARVTAAGEIKKVVATARKTCSALDAKLEDGYLAAGASLEHVQADLFRRMSAFQAAAGETNSRHANSGGEDASAGWKRVTDRINARITDSRAVSYDRVAIAAG